ncbi:MAG: LytTR family transcriptional regulator DNA-binding domain-containing protein [Bacteroidota bacterium]
MNKIFNFFENQFNKIESAFISDSLFSSNGIKFIASIVLGIYYSISILVLGTFNFATTLGIAFNSLLIFIVVFLATLICFFIYSFIEEKVFASLSRFSKYIMLILLDVVFVSAFLFLYVNTVKVVEIQDYTFFKLLQETLIIMILPSMLFVFSFENYLIREKFKIISMIKKAETDNKNKEIIIKSDNIKETLKINYENFIFAEASDNYTTIYYIKDDQICKVLFRITLKKLEDLFKIYDMTIRCHKSYLLNVNQIKEILGTSQNYRILVHNVDIQIPVSRNFPKSIIDSLKQRDVNN